jgi:hypothetical protein
LWLILPLGALRGDVPGHRSGYKVDDPQFS